MEIEKEVINWQALPPFALAALREELETAWLRGRASCAHWIEYEDGSEDPEQMAADYARRAVEGSTRPERPEVP